MRSLGGTTRTDWRAPFGPLQTRLTFERWCWKVRVRLGGEYTRKLAVQETSNACQSHCPVTDSTVILQVGTGEPKPLSITTTQCHFAPLVKIPIMVFRHITEM